MGLDGLKTQKPHVIDILQREVGVFSHESIGVPTTEARLCQGPRNFVQIPKSSRVKYKFGFLPKAKTLGITKIKEFSMSIGD